MSKKKRKKKKKYIDYSYKEDIKAIDKELKDTSKYLVKDILMMKEELKGVDEKAKKKAKRLAKGDRKKEKWYYDHDEKRLSVRRDKVREIAGEGFLDRFVYYMDSSDAVVKIVSRLVAALILTLLSMDSVKYSISDDTMVNMLKVYNIASKV